MYSRKSECIRAKVVVFGQKWFYSGKNRFIWAKNVYSGRRVCNQSRVVVFEKKLLYLDKVVVFGQNLFYSAKLF